jgi:predicted dehydrogenase
MVSLLIVGCGNRGMVYAHYAKAASHRCRVAAVSDSNPERRNVAQRLFDVDEALTFGAWQTIGERQERVADAVVIALQDRDHADAAVHFARLGYCILLEKPMATSLADCERIVAAAERADVIFAVGHVLRYTPYSKLVRRLLVDRSLVGDVVSLCHEEGVGYAHAAHSYVRGAWRREDESSPILLAKSCHDLDWIAWMMNGAKCTRVASVGSLRHFVRRAKPAEAGDATRCGQCPLEQSCAYSATRMYTGDGLPGHGGARKWARKIVDGDGEPVRNGADDEADVRRALDTGPFGRCVYECDNDVLDNQVVAMQFDNGASASFTLCAFSEHVCVRRTRIFGSRGELNGDGIDTVRHFDFASAKETVYRVADFGDLGSMPSDIAAGDKLSGHGGGDFALVRDFIDAVAFRDPSKLSATPRETLDSHRLVFAAERARAQQEDNLHW